MNATRVAALAVLCVGCTVAWSAYAYPERPLRFLIPFPPGGGADSLARIVGQAAGERLGQQIVIDNRPGAGGNIAAEALAKAKPGQLNYASSGNGGPSHLAMEMFKSMADVNIRHVPYKGGVSAMTDLIAGQVLKLPDVRERLVKQGFDVIGSTPGEFGAYIRSELKRWSRVVKASHASID